MRPILALSLFFAAPALADKQPHVDLVIAVDVSGSMRGLIDATRVKLWDVVRLLGQAQPQPQVRVGLVSYGGKSYDPRAGWVRRELDLTTDLDAVSARLFALTARGSEEYVARAVQTATRDLSWDQDPGTLKILFVAGNESAEQDPQVTLAAAMGEARRRGIHVNTIYCGQPEAREALAWRRGASLGGGEFAAIDHHHSAIARATPYDGELGRLSTALSHTYVGYGSGADKRRANQLAEDARAAADGPAVAAERAAAKASPVYNNADWDLVDAYAQKKTEKLPSGISDNELRTRLTQRNQLQQQIREVATRREAFLDSTTKAPIAAEPRAMVAATATPAPATPAPVHSAAAPPPPSAPTARKPAQKSMRDALLGTVRKQAIESGYDL